MKFNLKEKDQTPVGKRMEERYTYVSEDGSATVQFNAGKKAWTWEIGIATNEAGRKLANKLIEAFVKAGMDSMRDCPPDANREEVMDNACKTLEVK